MDDVRVGQDRKPGLSNFAAVRKLAAPFAIAALFCSTVHADSLPAQSVIYSFGAQSTDGAQPTASVIAGSDGNLYGTTSAGGAYGSGADGGGTIFKLSADGTETTLYSFHAVSNSGSCNDGATPSAALVEGSDGSFYGTTLVGGANCNLTTTPAGTVFKITSDGTFTSLYSFCSTGGDACTDGAQPKGALVLGKDGSFYGTTSLGGTASLGSIFKITPDGTFTTLYSFCTSGAPGCLDGASPQAGLIQGSDGNFYGTTMADGQNGGGTVFQITPAGDLTALYSFCDVSSTISCPDGSYPMASLVQGLDGSFYGTTSAAGDNIPGGSGFAATVGGTVFRITADGTLTTLYAFCAAVGCTDGSQPEAGLFMDANGDFYGTTQQGGSTSTPQRNNGTVFKITSTGTFTTIHSFCSTVQDAVCTDGRAPVSSLVADASGNLYGTTTDGGNIGTGGVALDAAGAVYELQAAASGGGSTGGGGDAVVATSSGASSPLMIALLGGVAFLKRRRRSARACSAPHD